ncbi:MAG: PIG-L family deacetylase [Chloroflexi bacterium]|nr:PIG-L family deacetylase [Chloroflexota bacterium]
MVVDYDKLQAIPQRDEPYHIVVTAAHHDDIEFGVAGSVARWIREEGATATYVIITDGGSGSNDPDVSKRALIELRREEQMEAASIVGVSDVRFLDYPDGTLQATLGLRRDITRIIRQTKPYRVVCQDPTTVYAHSSYINHPDHRAAGEGTLYAAFPSAETRPIFPELLAEGYEPHKIGELYLNLTQTPTHYHDISSTIELKMAALGAHVSQIGAGDDFENGAKKWLTESNRLGGEMVGVAYAEHFRVLKFDEERQSWYEEEKNRREAEAAGD